MYTDLDKNIKEEVIVLSHLQNKDSQKEKSSDFFYDNCNYRKFISSWLKEDKIKEKEKNKTKEEIKKEVEKEIKEEKEEISKKSKEKFYKIEKDKILELEKIFGSSTLKVHLIEPQQLGKGKMGSISEKKFIIYETTTFNKLYEIPFENTKQIRSVIELDNNDLVFFMAIEKTNRYKYDSELRIYRLKDQKYFLFQTIKEDMTGYNIQESYSGCLAYPKEFQLLKIKRLSSNRILSISNYGMRIYALNVKDNNCYSLILMDTHMEGIQEIYEINDNNLLFCINKHYGASMGGPAHDYIVIEKVEIKNITNEEKKRKLDGDEENYYWFDEDKNEENENKKMEEKKEIISSLKKMSVCKKLLEYSTYGSYHNLSDYVVLKNKYFIIMIDCHILIFNLLTGEQMIRYSIVEEGKKNLYIYKYMKIGKWICSNDNEFYINQKGNITLFELDDSKEINLKIIAYAYFPNEEYLNELDDNKFYTKNENNIIIYSK